MFFKTRKTITDAEKLDAVLEYLLAEKERWEGNVVKHGEAPKYSARLQYLEEQIALTSARRALENINPNAK